MSEVLLWFSILLCISQFVSIFVFVFYLFREMAFIASRNVTLPSNLSVIGDRIVKICNKFSEIVTTDSTRKANLWS